MKPLTYFPNADLARKYRHEYGTGGWIFEPEDETEAILFPPDMTPSDICNHATTKGKAGYLRGSQ